MKIPDRAPADLAMALEIGLTEAEFHHVEKKLGRSPTWAELGVFSAMFSEHCSYKSSKRFLRRFPTQGKHVLQGPGENAGVVDIGKNWAVAFKMESHNHPSYIEPYQGAATGVGGILRDIFTMGARPIASMNGLCFSDSFSPKMKSVVRGVVKGIGDYGNCVGVPTVSGKTVFHKRYEKNPLVNAFTLGLLRHEGLFRGTASGLGNYVVYAGARTGRDGVHGATMSSKEFSSQEDLEKPTVQVGDPFTEKKVLEATLEAMEKKLIQGVQDMGAAGLTSSSFEMAERSGTGLKLNLDFVPVREENLSAYELLLSESQERMLMVVRPEHWEELKEIFDRWELAIARLGEVVSGDRVTLEYRGETVVDLPVTAVTIPPMLERPFTEPGKAVPTTPWLSAAETLSWEEKLRKLTDSVAFSDLTPLVEQYDPEVGNRTLSERFDECAVLRLRETGLPPLAMVLEGNPRHFEADPREAGRRAIAGSVLRLATAGASPLGVTDCLNFGSPENPKVLGTFKEAIEGLAEGCEHFAVPVISGNVSLYNETDGKAILPTPFLGVVGLCEKELPAYLPKDGSQLFLLGADEGDLTGSLFEEALGYSPTGALETIDLSGAEKLAACLRKLRYQGLRTFTAGAEGGLFFSVVENLFYGNFAGAGLEISVPVESEPHRFLFGEGVPRAWALVPPGGEEDFKKAVHGIPWQPLGKTVSEPILRVRRSGDGDILFNEDLFLLRTKWSKKLFPFWE